MPPLLKIIYVVVFLLVYECKYLSGNLPFFARHNIDVDTHVHEHILTSMNARMQTLPLQEHSKN